VCARRIFTVRLGGCFVWINGADAYYSPTLTSTVVLRTAPLPVKLLVVEAAAGRRDNFAPHAAVELSDVVMLCRHRQRLSVSSTHVRTLAISGALTEAARLIGNDAAAAVVFYAVQQDEKALERQAKRVEERERAAREQRNNDKRRDERLRFALLLLGTLLVLVVAVIISPQRLSIYYEA
jgi:hypothetical protein